MSGDDRADFARGIAAFFLVVAVAFGALAFGGTERWAAEWLRVIAFAALAAALWSGTGPWPRAARALVLPAVGLVALAFFQTLPLPGTVLKVAASETAGLYERTVAPDGVDTAAWLSDRLEERGEVRFDPEREISTPTEDARPATAGRSISVNPHATSRAFWSWVTAIALFVAAAIVARSAVLRYRVLWGVVLLTGVLGGVGIVQQVAWNGKVLWLRDRPPGSSPLGPFVNPNHYAGFLEMGTLIAIGLALALVARHGERIDRATLRAALTDDRWTVPRVALATACCVSGVTGILLSHSRGGYLGFGIGLVFLFAARRTRAIPVALVGAIVLVGLAAGIVSVVGDGSEELERVPFAVSNTDPSAGLRLDTWGSTLRIYADHPVAGTGLGTFEWVFPSYQRAGEWLVWRYAHNDYVQLLAETGTIGLVLLLWGVWVFVRRAMLPTLGAAEARPRWTSVAVAAATFAMMVNTTFEFNLQIPANAALFATLVGVLCAAAGDGTE